MNRIRPSLSILFLALGLALSSSMPGCAGTRRGAGGNRPAPATGTAAAAGVDPPPAGRGGRPGLPLPSPARRGEITLNFKDADLDSVIGAFGTAGQDLRRGIRVAAS
jgi:hypothetical protein